jgi:hypothetical protein
MADTAASTQVGETAELIELILSCLPMLDIVAASGVNKTFRNVILNSVMLERNLFLRATDALPQYWLQLKCYGYGGRILFRAVTVDSDSLVFEPTPESSTENHDLPLRVVSACPFLKRSSEDQGFWAPYQTSLEHLEWNPCSVTPYQWYLLPAMDIHTGPWNCKQMFLTNPPCKSVRCTILWEGLVRGVLVITLEATRYVYRQEGVRFADLFGDTYSTLGAVVIHTTYEDGHWLTGATKGGGFACHMPMTSVHEQAEKCKKNYGELEMRTNNNSTVALLWTVVLKDDERNQISAKVEDKFYFTPEVKALPNHRRS